jgi:hypothetical protein
MRELLLGLVLFKVVAHEKPSCQLFHFIVMSH